MAASRRFEVRDRIAGLDAERDCEEIARLLATIEFPWDVTRALELALYRTYCVPSIGGLLDATQEFAQRTQRRYDDTALLLAEVMKQGLDSPLGRQAVRRINRIHHRFDISNDDMRYVLSTFVAVPLRWLDRFGWRPLSDHERAATYNYYKRLGHRMGIRGLPPTWREMIALSDAYEAEHFRPTAASARVGAATRELFVHWMWFLPAPLVRVGVHALLDEPVLWVFGFRPAPRAVRALAAAALRARGRLVRLLPPRQRAHRVAESWTIRSYPDGYAVDELGTDGVPMPGATEPRLQPTAQHDTTG
ncbi:MAG: DUF2236 domain-containing protein [Pseudonocardiaceae bacterium]|nr:DUF2236 domain-containing protein [Pseudonocardiaceae bacterium]